MLRLSHFLLPALFIAALLLLMTVFAPAHAADADVGGPAQTHNSILQARAGKFIQGLGDHVIKITADKQMSTDQRNAAFSKILGDDFDLQAIGRFVIGSSWNDATPAQRAEYMDMFKALIIKSYGGQITLATGDGFQVTGTRPESQTDTTVSSQFTHLDGSQPTSIEWRVRQMGGKTGVLDVVVEGISLSAMQRAVYTAVIDNDGGQVSGLLEAMRDQLKVQMATINTAR